MTDRTAVVVVISAAGLVFLAFWLPWVVIWEAAKITWAIWKGVFA